MNQINIDLPAIKNIAVIGVRRTAIFMGLGINAANDPEFKQYELAKFAHFIELLDLRGKRKPGILFTNFKKLRANCLITNGCESTEPDAELTRLDMKEVYSFYPGKSFAVRP